jgi:hypothetical protein
VGEWGGENGAHAGVIHFLCDIWGFVNILHVLG